MRIGIVDGFDHYPDLDSLFTVWIPGGDTRNYYLTPSPTGVGRCMTFGSGNLNAHKGPMTRAFEGAPSSKITLNFTYIFGNMAFLNVSDIEVVDEFANRQFGFGRSNLAKLVLLGEGGAIIAQSNKVLAVNVPYRICVTADSTAGVNAMTVSINGELDAGLNLTGVDIIDSPVSTLFGGLRLIGGEAFGDTRFDDIFVGLDECIQHGPKEILTSVADGAILSQFTTFGSGVNYQNVDETTSNLDTDYNFTETLGAKDTFTFANPTRVPESIISIGLVTHARKESSATRRLRNIMRIGGNEYPGVEHGLAEIYLWQEDHWMLNPNGNVPWTAETRAAAEGGYVLSSVS
jgi:hypothetical protein